MRVFAGDRAGRGPALSAPGRGWLVAAATLVVLLSIWIAGEFAPYRAAALSGEPLAPPDADHWLGTNKVGQDVASQMLLGARASIAVAVLAGGGAIAVGAVVGLSAAWSVRTADLVLMRMTDLALVVPRVPLLILVAAYLGASIGGTVLAIAATSWAPIARVIRARARGFRGQGHIRATAGFNAPMVYVLRRHLLPEVAPVLLASFVAAAGRAIMIEAGLALLGIGDPTRVSWGSIIREAIEFRSLFRTDAWRWWLLPPVLAVSLAVYSTSLLATALDARANPRAARRSGA